MTGISACRDITHEKRNYSYTNTLFSTEKKLPLLAIFILIGASLFTENNTLRSMREGFTRTSPDTSPCRCLTSPPPGGVTGTEVGLSPRGEVDNIVLDIDVSKSKREGSGPTDLLALSVILGAVARAHKLVLSSVPRDNAAEMSAHSVEAILLNGAFASDDKICCISLHSIKDELATIMIAYLQIISLENISTDV